MMRMLSNRFASNFLSSYKLCSKAEECMLKIGDILHQRRIFTFEDVIEYSKVSHDMNPLHFDTDCAQTAGFQDRLVHGILVASLFPRIISSHFVNAIARSCNWKTSRRDYPLHILEFPLHCITLSWSPATELPVTSANDIPGAVYVSQNLQFRQPVYVGDEIVGEVRANNIRGYKNNYIVKFSTRCLKKASDLVIDGEATAILPSLILQRQDHFLAPKSRGLL
ncbi:(R)-specific enoyl-CoA hydratase [Bienertia sinuspersici]